MKPGKEYEIFVYERFKDYFLDFNLILNDKIIGKQSQIKREIDISIKGKINNLELLYLVQCKDHNKPADIKIIGEFSSVIKDIGASKGYLICTSGFTKTIHQYANNLGIELVTVEDINSTKWKIEIEIPIIYIWKKFNFTPHFSIIATEKLALKNKTDLLITENDFKMISLNSGKNSMLFIDYLNYLVEKEKIDFTKTKAIKFSDPNLLLKFADIWLPIKGSVEFKVEDVFYFKYIKPDEYSQMTNHKTREVIPLKAKIHSAEFIFDESFIKIDDNNFPISAPLTILIEENIHPINQLKFTTNFLEFSIFR